VVRDPRPDPVRYDKVVDLADGTRRNMGWMSQVWHWDVLSQAERDKLFAYVGTVYIETWTNSGTWALYTGTLVWPEEEPEHFAGRVLGLDILFRKLQSFTEPA
jgi:hypothetical protein